MRRPSHLPLWVILTLAGVSVLLILLFWDYLWINLIHSGSVDAP